MSEHSLTLEGGGESDSLGSAPRPTAPPPRCGRGFGWALRALSSQLRGRCWSPRSGFARPSVSACPRRLPAVPCLPRCTVLGPVCGCPAMRVRIRTVGLPSGSYVYMLPIERNAHLIGRAAAPPPQPMDQGEVPPTDLLEA